MCKKLLAYVLICLHAIGNASDMHTTEKELAAFTAQLAFNLYNNPHAQSVVDLATHRAPSTKLDHLSLQLHAAAAYGRRDLIDVLMEHGAHIDAIDLPTGHTPLHNAVRIGCIETVKKLLEYEPNINLLTAAQETPLHCVLIARHKNVDTLAALLIKEGAALNQVSAHPSLRNSKRTMSELELAAHRNDACTLPLIQLLCTAGADIRLHDTHAYHVLKQLILNNNMLAVKYLLSTGKITPQDMAPANETPLLFTTILRHNTAITHLLLNHGADVTVSAPLSWGYSPNTCPLDIAARTKCVALVGALLVAGAQPTLKTFQEACDVDNSHVRCHMLRTPHNWHEERKRVMQESAEIIHMLSIVAPHIEPSIVGYAALKNNEPALIACLDAGCPINNPADHGMWTPLHTACHVGNKYAAQLLLAHGADKNAVDDKGYEPIHTAAFFQKITIVSLFMWYGVPVDTLTHNTVGSQKTAYELLTPTYQSLLAHYTRMRDHVWPKFRTFLWCLKMQALQTDALPYLPHELLELIYLHFKEEMLQEKVPQAHETLEVQRKEGTRSYMQKILDLILRRSKKAPH